MGTYVLPRFIGGLFVLLVTANTSQAQAAKLFVCETRFDQSSEVYRYEVGPAGVPTLDLTLTHPSFDKPTALAFSATGEMFVVNRGIQTPDGTGSLSRFLNPGGSPLFNGTINSMRPTFNFGAPHGGVFRRGELFITQGVGGGNVLRFVFDAAGAAIFNGAITQGLGSVDLRGVAVNPTTGELLVADQNDPLPKIHRYLIDADGNAIPNGVITGPGVSSPHDMAWSPRGELFVANHTPSTVSRFIFDAIGNASFNGQITGNELKNPMGLDFSPWGELFVASTGAPVVSRWTFDAPFNAIPNGSFHTPQTLGDLQFLPISAVNAVRDVWEGYP